MSIKFLCTGDLHLANYQPFSYIREDGYNSRLWNCAKVFDIIKREALARGIKRVLLNGDLFQNSEFIEVEVYDLCYRKLEELYKAGLEVVINVGNHDIYAKLRGRILHSLRPFRRVARIVEKPDLIWGCLQVVPWDEDSAKLKEAISKGAMEHVPGLVLHCGVQGARTGPKNFIPNQGLRFRDIKADKYTIVLLSDFHTQQHLSKNAWYLGSPIIHSFGEIHRPAIWSIVLDRHKYSAEKIYTRLPRFRTIQANTPEDLQLKLLPRYKGDYVKCKITSAISAKLVEQLAAKIGCRIQIVRSKVSTVKVQIPKTLEISKAIQRYAAGKSRLIKLGLELSQ
jgi:DNA repair exonuclease SbcCD nuclease subunit